MSVVPICYKMPYRDQTQQVQCITRQSEKAHRSERGFRTMAEATALQAMSCDSEHRRRSFSGFDSQSRVRFLSDSSPNDKQLSSVVPICYKMPYRDQNQQIQCITRQSEKAYRSERVFRTMAEATTLQAMSCDSEHLRRSFSGFDSHSRVRCSSDSSPNDKQLSSLSSYFGKLQDDNKSEPSIQSSTNQLSSKKRLETLDAYLDKLDKANSEANLGEDNTKLIETTSSSFDEDSIKGSAVSKPFFTNEDSERDNEAIHAKTKSYMNHRNKNAQKSPQMLQEDNETSDLYLISILASINIAVILFEIASPVRNSELELSSLPLLYGAKVNHLILVGEWWRLVTPMFLHSGFFHIALSCWALLTFGPKVCKGYGSFTFILIYILGGISGNLISYLHTPDPTVGGTGPVYAIIGAWLIYQNQNKDVIAKDLSESMFQKAIIATGLGLILTHFCPIDEWSHFGAAFTGVAYGFLACPTLQLGDAASRNGQEEGITLVKQQADPCKSLLLFGVFVVVLSSLFFIVEPPLNDLVAESFL